MSHQLLSGRIVLDSSNNQIRFSEGGSAFTVTLTEGPYHLYGDAGTTTSPEAGLATAGLAAGSVLAELVTQLEAQSPAGDSYRAYYVPFSDRLFGVLAERPGGRVTIVNNDSSTMILVGSHADTTFPLEALGFVSGYDVTPGSGFLTSCLTPGATWVADVDGAIVDQEPPTRPAYEVFTRGGYIARGRTGSRLYHRKLDMRWIRGHRTYRELAIPKAEPDTASDATTDTLAYASAAATTITLDSGTNTYANGDYIWKADGEVIILGTHTGSGVYTGCTRGALGSTATPHGAGTACANGPWDYQSTWEQWLDDYGNGVVRLYEVDHLVWDSANPLIRGAADLVGEFLVSAETDRKTGDVRRSRRGGGRSFDVLVGLRKYREAA